MTGATSQAAAGEHDPLDGELIDEALACADALLSAVERLEQPAERRRRRRLDRMLTTPGGVELALALTDEVARIREDRRAARRFAELGPDVHAARRSLGGVDRALIAAGRVAASTAPRLVMPLVRRRLRRESRGVILPAADPAFARHVAARRAEGARLNVNLLGEAILGEREAARRLDDVIARLRRNDVDYVSIKISAISSHVDPLSFDATVATVADRLRRLYVVAREARPAKFVNLDMEEYRDLHLTAAAFRRALDAPGLRDLDVGIALQAYLPDSHAVLSELGEWALARRAAGGGELKVRLVKGANLSMEEVEAELRGWPLATYGSKAEVDASYKRLLDAALDPRFDGSIRVGLASHNLFDVAWGITVARRSASTHRLQLEMLEGMAEASAAAARERAGSVLLYEPIVRDEEYDAALAYLARRLEENAGSDNFLRAFLTRESGDALEGERRRFIAAVHARHAVSTTSRRALPLDPPVGFHNEADTDWTQATNRAWLATALSAPPPGGDAPDSPIDKATVDAAVARAAEAGRRWAATPTSARRETLLAVAEAMARARGETLATMAHTAVKTIGEGDPEVSEGIDFARYYADRASEIDEICTHSDARFQPLGTVVVSPPWNFPYSIPAGGVLAALAAGNAVILKPAPEVRAVGALLAEHCWAGGVPRDLLQLVPCDDDEAGRRLITHPDVDAVILTGSYETADAFLAWRPDLHLLAETSGKNAIVITACADLDLAIRDLVRSAFGHAGQKCSAASLAIVEASVHDDPRFLERLADAVASLRLGPAADLATDMAPLVRPADGSLLRALTELDPGERWLVEPRRLDDRGVAWSPGVRLGVQPGSWFHMTECFGPVLGVLRAPDLATAVAWQNMPPFGLTGGIHTLDPAEVAQWLDAVEVGNAYVNRGITGAIVQRQPFGGWKRSAVGSTTKAGGPDHVASLGRWSLAPGATGDGAEAMGRVWDEMRAGSDPTGLRAERNLLRYRPLRRVLLRAGDDVDDRQLDAAMVAATTIGVQVELSTPRRRRAPGAVQVVEDDEALAARAATATVGVDRVRLLGAATPALLAAMHALGAAVDTTAAIGIARLELVHWSRAQAVSETLHRHGHVRGVP